MVQQMGEEKRADRGRSCPVWATRRRLLMRASRFAWLHLALVPLGSSLHSPDSWAALQEQRRRPPRGQRQTSDQETATLNKEQELGCFGWVSEGACKSNPEWMLVHCALACDAKGPTVAPSTEPASAPPSPNTGAPTMAPSIAPTTADASDSMDVSIEEKDVVVWHSSLVDKKVMGDDGQIIGMLHPDGTVTDSWGGDGKVVGLRNDLGGSVVRTSVTGSAFASVVTSRSVLDGDKVSTADGRVVGHLQDDGETVVNGDGQVVGIRQDDGAVVSGATPIHRRRDSKPYPPVLLPAIRWRRIRMSHGCDWHGRMSSTFVDSAAQF